MKNVTEVVVLIIYTSMIFVLVRPDSQGPSLVKNFGDALTSLVNASTGGGGWVKAH